MLISERVPASLAAFTASSTVFRANLAVRSALLVSASATATTPLPTSLACCIAASALIPASSAAFLASSTLVAASSLTALMAASAASPACLAAVSAFNPGGHYNIDGCLFEVSEFYFAL